LKSISIKQPQHEKPKDASCSQTSHLQEADLVLRRYITTKMQEAKGQNKSNSDLADLALHLNNSRKLFLKQISDTSSMTDVVDHFRQFVDQ
jgi:hypothetical protein